MDLIKMSPDKLAAILAYHSLIGGVRLSSQHRSSAERFLIGFFFL